MFSTSKKIIILSFSCLVFLSYQEKAVAQKMDHNAGDIIVMMNYGSDVQKLMKDFTVFNNQPTDLAIVGVLSKRLNTWLLHFNASIINENDFLSGIRNSKLVKLAQFNHYIESRNTPNDPDFPQQWNMLNVTSGADIRATSAWDLTTGGLTAGGDTIVVAIDDDGFELTHHGSSLPEKSQ
jgi:hypothetical protein